ncbi:hypothetical protein SMC26_32830 [Actinomadura fulvescens]|uniref:Secreted protein n=1 Tax=Actinomadura fulvescens TaxID=46160 RepID=A0ABN3QBR5_9ACTN
MVIVLAALPHPVLAAPSPVTPVRGLAVLDLGSGLDLEGQGIIERPVNGAIHAAETPSIDTDQGVTFKMATGSNLLARNGQLTAGTFSFQGGVELSKGRKKVVLRALTLNVATGQVTAVLGSKTQTVGTFPLRDVEVSAKRPGSLDAVITFGGPLTMNAQTVAGMDAALGSQLAQDVDQDTGIEVPMQIHAVMTLTSDLAAAFDLDLDAVQDLDLDLGIHLL